MGKNEIEINLQNFYNSLNKLEEFLQEPIQNDRDKAGIIQAFEYTFELAWKTIQKMVATHGKTVGSARQAFQAAHELGWIKAEVGANGEDVWSAMTDDRNLTSHTYKEDIAIAVLTRIQKSHFERLKILYQLLKEKV